MTGRGEFARIEEAFHRLTGLPEAEREAALEALAAGDPALAAEVRPLLEAQREGEAVERGLEALGTALEASLGEHPESIGPYRLGREIGAGGWGRVFEAEQGPPLRRAVAVKVLHPGMNSRSVLRRFQRELDALGRMDHPGIARVHHAGLTGEGLPYVVMELIRGRRLDEHCAAHRLGLWERVALLVKVCEAVQHAHAKGIIHRDLKPANILVEEEGSRPVVIDFGIAKAITEDEHSITATGDRRSPGTAEYMSPEQAAGPAGEVDARTDVYALGVVLYLLATGVLPFTADRAARETGGDLLRLVREHPARAPSAAGRARGLRVPREIDWIVRRCLEKRARDRYQSVSELRQDLERFLRHEPLSVGPPTALYRARSLVRRHPLGVFGAVTLVGALVLGGSLATAGLVQARAARAEERSRHDELQVIAWFMLDMFQSVESRNADGRERELLLDMLRRFQRQVDERQHDPASTWHPFVTPEAEARLRWMTANGFHGLYEFELAIQERRRYVELIEQVFGPLSRDAYDARFWLWEDCIPGRDWETMLETAPLQLRTAEALEGADSPAALRVYNYWAIALEESGRLAEAEAMNRRALEVALAQRPPILLAGTLMLNIGELVEARGETDEARRLFERAEAWARQGSPEHKEWKRLRDLVRVALAPYWAGEGRADEALAVLQDYLVRTRDRVSIDNRDVVAATRRIAQAHIASGDCEAARAVMEDLVAQFEARREAGQSAFNEPLARQSRDEVRSLCDADR